jgi:hypothetical protein
MHDILSSFLLAEGTNTDTCQQKVDVPGPLPMPSLHAITNVPLQCVTLHAGSCNLRLSCISTTHGLSLWEYHSRLRKLLDAASLEAVAAAIGIGHGVLIDDHGRCSVSTAIQRFTGSCQWVAMAFRFSKQYIQRAGRVYSIRC